MNQSQRIFVIIYLEVDNCYIDKHLLESSDVTGGGAELFLYQSGYFTIKKADEISYMLGIPNYEVDKALYQVVLPALAIELEDTGKGLLDWTALKAE